MINFFKRLSQEKLWSDIIQLVFFCFLFFGVSTLFNSTFDFKPAPKSIIKNFSVRQLPATPGSPVKWVKEVAVSQLTIGEHFLSVPKEAMSVKISTATKASSTKNPTTLTLADRKLLSQEAANRPKVQASTLLKSQSKTSSSSRKLLELKGSQTSFFSTLTKSFSQFGKSLLATVEEALPTETPAPTEVPTPVVETPVETPAPTPEVTFVDLTPVLPTTTPTETATETPTPTPTSETATTTVEATPITPEVTATTTPEVTTTATSTPEVVATVTTTTPTSTTTETLATTTVPSTASTTPETLLASTTSTSTSLLATTTDPLSPIATSTASTTILVEYETPAPTIAEADTDTGKIVQVSASETETPITNVLAFTNIPEIYKVGQESKIKIKWTNNNDQNVTFHAYDLNGNGKLDYVEWTVPHLSTQTFEIIFISKAFQLDANQNILADIYDQTKTQDNNWVTVNNTEIVRVTFEQTLDQTKDNTLYTKPTNSNQPATIEVYPVYTDEAGNLTEGPKVATFNVIDHPDTYKVYLTDLTTPTDMFDLKVTGQVDIDYIVDPSPANLYWRGATTSWNTATNWSQTSGGPADGWVPTSTDTAIFDGGGTGNCSIDVNASVGAFSMVSGYTGTITQSSTFTVTIGTGGFSQAAGTFTGGSGAITNAGSFTITAGSFTSTTGVLSIAGNFSNAGTFTPSTGTVTFTGTGAGGTIAAGGASFYNFIQNGAGGTYTLQSAITATNNLTITAGTLDVSTSNYDVTVGGTWSRAGTFTARAGTVVLTGTSTFSDTMSFYNLTINGSTKTVTLGGALTVANNLTITSGTLDVSATSKAVSVGGSFSNAGTFTARAGTLTMTGTGSLNSGGSTLYNFTVNGAGQTVTLGGVLTATNNLTITAGALDVSTSNYDITVGLTWSNLGTFTARNGTVTLTGTATITNGIVSFYNLTINGSGKTVTLGGALTVANNLTITAGTLDVSASNRDVTVGGTWSRTGTFTARSGNLILTGTSTFADTMSFYKFTVNGAGQTVTLGANLTVSNTLTITAGTLDVSASNCAGASCSISLAGAWSNLGTFNGRTGTVTLTNTTTLTNGIASFYNLTINGSAKTVTLGANLTVLNNLTITLGTLDVSASNYSVTVGGTWSRVGTFTARSGTLVLTGTSAFSDTMSFYNLTINGPGQVTTLGTTTNITNNLTLTAGELVQNSKLINTGGLTIDGGTFTGSASKLTVIGDFLMSSGIFTAPTTTFYVSGNYSVLGGAFNHNSGNVALNSTINKTLTCSQSFNNLSINDGLVGYWKLDEGTGNLAVDSSGNGNNGTFPADITYSTEVPTGTNFSNPRSVAINGTSGYIDCGTSRDLNIRGSLTFSAWVKFNTLGAGYIGGWDYGLNRRKFFMYSGAPLQASVFKNDSSTTKITGNTILQPGRWYFLAFVYTYIGDGTSLLDLYVDGVPDATRLTNAVGPLQDLTFPGLMLGARIYRGFEYTLDGLLDDVRLYNRPLSAAEILTLAQGGEAVTTVTATTTLASALTVGGDLILGSGALDTSAGNNYPISVFGNWFNRGGSLAPQQGTVTLNGGNQSITGSTTFYNLLKTVTSASSLTFSASSTQTITNALTLGGATGNLLSLRSSIEGTQWKIDPQGTRTIDFVDVKDSNNTNASAIDLTGMTVTNSGNNTNWGSGGTPIISNISPVDGSTIATGGQITFTTDEAADCRLALSDTAKSYDQMASDTTCSVSNGIQMSCTFPDLGSAGTKNIYLACQDALGNKDTVFSVTHLTYTRRSRTVQNTIATTTSSGASTAVAELQGPFNLVVNNGDRRTDNRLVVLNLSAGANASLIALSTTPDFAVVTTIPYQTSYQFDLCQSRVVCENKIYTIYARFMNNSGQASPVISADISLSGLVTPVAEATTDTAGSLADNLAGLVSPLLPKTEEKVDFPPLAEAVPKVAPTAFQNRWPIVLPASLSEFVFQELPPSFQNIVSKFPQLEDTLKKIGVTRMSHASTLSRLGRISLPGLSETVGLSRGESLVTTDILPQQVNKIPTDLVFVKNANESIDLDIKLSISNSGLALETVNTMQGQPLKFIVRPGAQAETVLGYLVYKNSNVDQVSTAKRTVSSLDRLNLAASAFSPEPVLIKTVEKGEVGTSTDLVLSRFEYKNAGQGLWTAEVQSPLALGQYELRTVIKYKERAKPKTLSMVMLVDPEGYVYKTVSGEQVRIKTAIVSLYELNQKTNNFDLWPAGDYRQENPQKTDVTGRYAFLVPAGTYKLKATAPGYFDYESESFKVEESKGVFMNIELKEKFNWLKLFSFPVIICVILIYIAFIITRRRQEKDKML